MPQVRFTRQWFGPDATRYRPGVWEVSSGLLSALPKGAEVLEEPKPEPKAAKAKAEE